MTERIIMRYTPKINNTKPLLITILLTVIAISDLLFASQMLSLKWLFQLLFLCFATCAMQIFIKYVLTTYEYYLEENTLYIYKILGKRKLCVANFVLSNIENKLEKLSDCKSNESEFSKKEILNYVRNMQFTDIYSLTYNLYGTRYLVKLETDENFALLLNERIECAIREKDDDQI